MEENKTKASDILIRIHLDGKRGSIDPKLFFRALEHLENSIYSSDRDDVETARKFLSLSPLVVDASLERLRNYRNKRVMFLDARAGSIELLGVGTTCSTIFAELTISVK